MATVTLTNAVLRGPTAVAGSKPGSGDGVVAVFSFTGAAGWATAEAPIIPATLTRS
jgi:hypothetical protein